MLNRVQLIGFLGANPELRYTPEREAIARVRIATSETWKKNGAKQEKTEWHNLVFFGKLAEIVGDHLKKGNAVYVEGRLQTRSWDKDGETRYSTEIVADVMRMLPNGNKDKPEPKAPVPMPKGRVNGSQTPATAPH
jgi:single-strand DNA-binding protein